jgi:hypothetical protein
MIWPSTEGQERQNAYTDWLLRQRDEQEAAAERRAEARDPNVYRPSDGHAYVNDWPTVGCDRCAGAEHLHTKEPTA